VFLIPAIILVGCIDNKDENGDKQIGLIHPSEQEQYYIYNGTTGDFTFNARSAWTATVTESTNTSSVS